MDGDTVSTEGFAIHGKLQYVGSIAAAGVAQRSNFVDVDTESGHIIKGINPLFRCKVKRKNVFYLFLMAFCAVLLGIIYIFAHVFKNVPYEIRTLRTHD